MLKEHLRVKPPLFNCSLHGAQAAAGHAGPEEQGLMSTHASLGENLPSLATGSATLPATPDAVTTPSTPASTDNGDAALATDAGPSSPTVVVGSNHKAAARSKTTGKVVLRMKASTVASPPASAPPTRTSTRSGRAAAAGSASILMTANTEPTEDSSADATTLFTSEEVAAGLAAPVVTMLAAQNGNVDAALQAPSVDVTGSTAEKAAARDSAAATPAAGQASALDLPFLPHQTPPSAATDVQPTALVHLNLIPSPDAGSANPETATADRPEKFLEGAAHPDAFDALAKTPASFIKQAADLHTPMLATDPIRSITAVDQPITAQSVLNTPEQAIDAFSVQAASAAVSTTAEGVDPLPIIDMHPVAAPASETTPPPPPPPPPSSDHGNASSVSSTAVTAAAAAFTAAAAQLAQLDTFIRSTAAAGDLDMVEQEDVEEDVVMMHGDDGDEGQEEEGSEHGSGWEDAEYDDDAGKGAEAGDARMREEMEGFDNDRDFEDEDYRNMDQSDMEVDVGREEVTALPADDSRKTTDHGFASAAPSAAAVTAASDKQASGAETSSAAVQVPNAMARAAGAVMTASAAVQQQPSGLIHAKSDSLGRGQHTNKARTLQGVLAPITVMVGLETAEEDSQHEARIAEGCMCGVCHVSGVAVEFSI